jgi:hypothetical protein
MHVHGYPTKISYHIAGNFQGRKLLQIGRKRAFHEDNFHGMRVQIQNFTEKTFMGGSANR